MNIVFFYRSLKNQVLDSYTMEKYVSNACNSCSIKGEFVAHGIALQDLRGTVATRLLETWHSNASVAF